MLKLKPLKNIKDLPNIEEVINISKSLATIEAILMPRWEFRYFSFNQNWDDNQYMASLRDGEGSHYYIFFNIENNVTDCLGKIYDKESLTSNIQKNIKKCEYFKIFLDEVAFENDYATLYFHFNHLENAWESIPFENNVPFLGVFKYREEAYLPWAEQYYEMDIDKDTIRDIFEFKPLTQKMVSKLNKKMIIEDILEDLNEIGYPYCTMQNN